MKKRTTISRLMLERVLKLHEMIKSGSYPNSGALAKELGVSISTISLDISFLRQRYYAPIKYDVTKNGFYYTKPYDLPSHGLSKEEIDVLISAKTLLSHFEGTPIYDKLFSIINFIAPNDKNKNPMINRIVVPPVSTSVYDKTAWKEIYDAMKTNQIIEFDYNGLNRPEETHRRVHPYQLVMNEGQVYIFGFSEERDAERIFNLARLSNLVITEDQFELPENYDFLQRSNEGKFGLYYQSDITQFKIRFFGVMKQVVQERKWSDDQVIDDQGDYIDLTFSSNQQLNVLHWILSLGYSAQPLEPDWFVGFWKDTIIKSAKLAGIKEI